MERYPLLSEESHTLVRQLLTDKYKLAQANQNKVRELIEALAAIKKTRKTMKFGVLTSQNNERYNSYGDFVVPNEGIERFRRKIDCFLEGTSLYSFFSGERTLGAALRNKIPLPSRNEILLDYITTEQLRGMLSERNVRHHLRRDREAWRYLGARRIPSLPNTFRPYVNLKDVDKVKRRILDLVKSGLIVLDQESLKTPEVVYISRQ